MKRQYIIRKYVMAKNVIEALRLDKVTKPDEAWVDEEWRKANPEMVKTKIGFNK